MRRYIPILFIALCLTLAFSQGTEQQIIYIQKDVSNWDTLQAYYDTSYIKVHFNYFTQDSIQWDTLGAYIDSTDTAQYAKRTDADHYWGGMSEYKISTKINTHDSIPYLVVNNHYAPDDSITLYISATGKGNAEKIKVAMPDSIALTPGTDTTLQENYVYYHYNGGAPELLVSFTEIEHNGKGAIYDSLVPIGNYGLGAVSDSNSVVVWKYNDYRNILNKGMMFINYRLRERTIYEDGIVPTIRAKSLATSEGLVLQSKHIYIPARDNRSGDVLITPVFADSNYAHWDSLDGFYEYSDGTNIGTGQYLWLVLWGSASEDSTKYQLYLNIQSGEHTYKKLKDCEQDKYNMMPTAIPPEFSETGFLICAMIWANNGDSIATLSDGSKYRDLRGFCSGVQGGIGAPPTDSAQVASWNFINDLDTLGAYLDTTNHFGSLDSFYVKQDTVTSEGWIKDGDTLVIDTTSGGGGGAETGGHESMRVADLTAYDTLVVGQDSVRQYLKPLSNYRIYLDTTGAKAGDKFIIRNSQAYTNSYSIEIYSTSGDYLNKIYSNTIQTYVYNGDDWRAGDNTTKTGTDNNYLYNIAIGKEANAYDNGIAIGIQTNAYHSGVAIGGSYANAYSDGVAIGTRAKAYNNGVAIGTWAHGYTRGIALGYKTYGYNYGIAIGYYANANNKHYAIAKGYYSKCERYNEEWKCADGLAINKAGYGKADWFGTTSDSTTTELFLGNGSNQRFTILANSVVSFVVLVSAIDTATGEAAGYEIKGVIKRDNSGNTSLVGTATTTVLAEEDANWDAWVEADDTNEALIIKVKGDDATETKWNARVEYSEIRY